MSELDNLLDIELDDLSDIPTFEPYHEGVHRVLVTLESKEVAKHPSVECGMKLVETVELANPSTDKAMEAGAESNCLFMLDNEFGQGKLKMVATALAPTLGTTNLAEIVERCNDIECHVVTTKRKDKEEADKYYTNIKEIRVV